MENESTESTESTESMDTGTENYQEASAQDTDVDNSVEDNSYDQDYKDDFSVNAEGTQDDNQDTEPEDYSNEDINSAMMDYLRENYEMPDKFQDVEGLINSYKHLEGKMGNMKGAPEQYELEANVFDNYDEGVLESVVGVATEMGLDNDGLNKILGAAMDAQNTQSEASWEMEKGKLGNNADQQIANALQRLDANYPPEISEQIQSMVQTADQFRALETIMSAGQQSAPAQSTQGNTQPSDGDINKMLFAKDEYGNSRMETDPAYEAKVRNMMNTQWG